MPDENRTSGPNANDTTSDATAVSTDEDERAFYTMLERNGQLVDVPKDADLTQLPPRITHVRYPDGRIERIGFAG